MDLNQEPLPPPTLPPPNQPSLPPDEPPDLFAFPPEDFNEEYYCPPFGYNPDDFLEKSETSVEPAARALRHEIINGLHGPLQFRTTDSPTDWHGRELTELTQDQFMLAFNTVILALDAGYYPTRNMPLLGAQGWAALSSAVLAAVGRGYARSSSIQNEDILDRIHKATRDTSMSLSDPPFETMFDRLTATAEHLHTYLAPNFEGAGDWIAELKDKTHFFLEYHASQMITEALEEWKVFQIR